ncbi:hypothetical protein CsSME_00036235 [Camellia sinensis var. sinensis]
MGHYCFLIDTPVALAAFREEYGVPADGSLGECPFTVLSIIEGGLCFPAQPLICEFLRRTGLALTQYTLDRTDDELNYYLKIRLGKEKLVTGTPDKDIHDDDFSGY